MASIKVLHIFIILILAKDIYGFPKIDFKRRVDIRQMKSTHRPNSEIIMYVVLNKHNRTHEAITSNCTTTEDFGKQFRLELEMDIWGDGGWKRNIVHYEKDNSCEQLKFVLGPMWDDIMTRSTATTSCPCPKGFYHIEDYYVDATAMPLIFATGLFKLIMTLTKNQIFVMDLEIIFEITALYI